MKKCLTILFAGLLFSSVTGVQAAPVSGYNQFVASLDSILEVSMPVADEQLIAARLPAQPNGQAARVLAIAGNMLGQPVVWGGAHPWALTAPV